jgi:choline dehydrogenase
MLLRLDRAISSVLVLTTAAYGLAKDSFDYVIVGGGTCGLTVANRLSETSGVTVAVIEAGGDERNNPNVTSVAGFGLSYGTSIDWQYHTAPQAYATNQEIDYHAGKALGGTSTINGMTYIRSQKREIDTWEALGNKGWNWDSLYPYYLKSERFQIPTKAQAVAGASYVKEYHGWKGPMKVGYPYRLLNGSFPSLVRETWKRLGMFQNPDANGGDLHGFSVWPQTLDRAANVREDAARAYYYPVQDRPNLVVYRGIATRILWQKGSQSSGKAVATGVQYVSADGVLGTIHAVKEVILSAGSIRSPAILELSGVGNPSILDSYNISTKVPLPGVGENAQDQANTAIMFSTNMTLNGTAPYVTYESIHDLFGSQADDMARSTAQQIKAWSREIAKANGDGVNAASIEKLLSVQHDMIFHKNISCVEILTTASGHNLASAFWISFPFSRGNVHIRSASPLDYPVINPNYFMVDWDTALQMKIKELVMTYWTSGPISSIVGDRIQPNVSTVPDNSTTEEWTTWVKSSFSANHHLLGTAAMLPRELGGVVDKNLTVYGTYNVRVIDASVLPMQVSGHLTSTLYAISERAADMIKENGRL